LRRQLLDARVDSVAVGDDASDQLAGQFGGLRIALELREVPFQDGGCGALAEVRFEDRREGQPPTGTFRSDVVRPRQ
jgi:hypothetical protein